MHSGSREPRPLTTQARVERARAALVLVELRLEALTTAAAAQPQPAELLTAAMAIAAAMARRLAECRREVLAIAAATRAPALLALRAPVVLRTARVGKRRNPEEPRTVAVLAGR